MKVAVFEYVSGGGFSERMLPTSLLSEGFIMLYSVLTDLQRAGHSTMTLLDSRLTAYRPVFGGSRIEEASSQSELDIRLGHILRQADSALMIAPEEGGTLVRYIKMLKGCGIVSLNSKAEDVALVSDKQRFYDRLMQAHLPIPITRYVRLEEEVTDIDAILEGMELPVVIKPSEGAGCFGISLARTKWEVAQALQKALRETRCRGYVIQEFIKGVDCSVNLVSNGRVAMPMSLNLQKIELSPPHGDSRYRGGLVPLDHPLKKEVFELTRRAVELFSGLKGFIGVDLILSEQGPVLLEINPRITVSYAGLSKVCIDNPAQIFIDACLDGSLPAGVKLSGYADFFKIGIPSAFNQLSVKDSLHADMIPPFISGLGETFYTFLISRGRSRDEAANRVSSALQHLAATFR